MPDIARLRGDAEGPRSTLEQRAPFPLGKGVRGLGLRTVLPVLFLALLLAACDLSPNPAIVATVRATRTEQANPVRRWTFDADPVRGIPNESIIFGGVWLVRAEPDAPSPANAFCQGGRAEFPSLMLGGLVYTDLVLSARVKVTGGREDHAAGLIFRVRDRKNYYALAAGVRAGTLGLYKYAEGRWSVLAERPAPPAATGWPELQAEARGDRLRGLLDGAPVVEATDPTFREGRIGLWTKGDTAACFDDVSVAPL